ncbi:MAG: hypothetical protein Q9167_006290 [Letrouitia subvulpina]
MRRSLDLLICHLLEEVALCGDHGAGPSDFIHYVKSFYPQNTESDVPKVGDGIHPPPTTQNVDRKFLETVWIWLSKRQDVQVGENDWAKGLSLSEFEAWDAIVEQDRHSITAIDQSDNEGINQNGGNQNNTVSQVASTRDPGVNPSADFNASKTDQSSNQTPLRIYASTERRWQALAGHRPDPSKIPKLDFACLSIIGARKEAGILQPELVRLSGQDKRSVPDRTRRLYERGYIDKIPVLVKQSHTSKLTLKRFAKKINDESGLNDSSIGTIQPESKDTAIDYHAFLRRIFDILKKVELITLIDFKEQLGVIGRRWSMKFLANTLRRLESFGCLKQVKAQPTVETLRPIYLRCVKFIREPVGREWHPVVYHGATESAATNRNTRFDVDPDVEVGIDTEYQEEEVHYLSAIAKERGASQLREVERPVPLWTGDEPLNNLIINVLEQSGTRGLSSMEVKQRTLGKPMGRTVENHVSRLADCWQVPRPPSRRHLAVVRDTAMTGKVAHYVYYTFDNFQRLVDSGDKSWEAVSTEAENNKKSRKIAPPNNEPDLDEFGFPRIDSNRFLGQDNDATLSECEESAIVKPLSMSSIDPRAFKLSDNSWGGRFGFVSSAKDESLSISIPNKKRTYIRRHHNDVPDLVVRSRVRANTVQKTVASSKYKKLKLEREILKRIEEGKDRIIAMEEVIALAIDQYREYGAEPPWDIIDEIRSPPSKLTAPKSTVKSVELLHDGPRGTSCRIHSLPFEYLPSIAAHSQLTIHLDLPLEADSQKLGIKDNAHLPLSSLKAPKKRGRPPVNRNNRTLSTGRTTLQLPYIPSILAHTQHMVYPASTDRKTTMKRKRTTTQENSNKVPKRSVLPFDHVSAQNTITKSKRISKKRTITEVGIQSNINDEKPFAKIPRVVTYDQQLRTISRRFPGVFFGKEAQTIRSGLSGRPRKSRMAIFKTQRLNSLPWFSAEAPGNHGSSVSAERRNSDTLATTAISRPTSPAADYTSPKQLAEMANPSETTAGQSCTGSPLPSLESNTHECAYSSQRENQILNEIHGTRPSTYGAMPTSATTKNSRKTDNSTQNLPYKVGEHRSSSALRSDLQVFEGDDESPRLENLQTESSKTLIGYDTDPPSRWVGPKVVNDPMEKFPNGNLQRQTDSCTPPISVLYADVRQRDSENIKTAAHQDFSDSSYTYSRSQSPGFSEPALELQSGLFSNAAQLIEFSTPSMSTAMSTNNAVHGLSSKEGNGVAPNRGIFQAVPLGRVPALSEQPNVEDEVQKDADRDEQVFATTDLINDPNLRSCHGSLPGFDDQEVAIGPSQNSQNTTTEQSKGLLPEPVESLKQKKKAGKGTRKMTTQGGSLAILRKKIIMEIVEKCSGVFPGSREITNPFNTEWQKMGQSGRSEWSTISTAVKALCDSGKLRQIKFCFKSSQGIVVTKSILTKIDISPTDPRVSEMQSKITNCYPRSYVPDEVEVADEVRDSYRYGRSNKMRTAANLELIESQVQIQHKPEYLKKSELDRKALDAYVKNATELNPDKGKQVSSIYRKKNIPSINATSSRSHGMLLQSDDARSVPNMPQRKVERLTSIKETVPRSNSRVSSLTGPLTTAPTQDGKNQEREAPGGLEKLGLQKAPFGFDRVVTLENIDSMPARDISDGGNSTTSPATPSILNSRAHDGTGPHGAASTAFMPPATEVTNIGFEDPNLDGQIVGNDQALKAYMGRQPYTRSRGGQGARGRRRPFQPIQSKHPTFLSRSNILSRSSERHLITPASIPRTIFEECGGLSWNARRLMCSIMYPDQALHSTTHTFSTLVSGFARTKSILDAYGWRSRPRKTFHDLVDDLLRWELETKDGGGAVYANWPFIHHIIPHKFEAAERPVLDHDLASHLQQAVFQGLHSKKVVQFSEPFAWNPADRIPSQSKWNIVPAKRKRVSRNEPLKRRRQTLSASAPVKRKADMLGLENAADKVQAEVRPKKRVRRNRRTKEVLNEATSKRLLVAVTVIRVLTGGVDRSIDWFLVARQFHPKYTLADVQKHWPYVLRHHRVQAQKLESDFQAMFTKAYEDGTVPSIDFRDLQSYDWPWLINWTMENVNTAKKSALDLPATRAEMDTLFIVKEEPRYTLNAFYEFDTSCTIKQRNIELHKEPLGMPLDVQSVGDERQKLDVAKTWIRANTMTPGAVYNPESARQKLSVFSDDLLDQAIDEMVESRVLVRRNKGRPIPGQNYDLTEHFLRQLRKKLGVSHFQRAAIHKQEIDRILMENGSMILSRVADNAFMLSVFNMQAHYRINIRPKNPPMYRWGLCGKGNYQTRAVDKSKLHFDLEIRPLDSYVMGNPLWPLPPPPSMNLEDCMAKIPLWYNVHHQFAPNIWKMALAVTLVILARRPGVSAKGIEESLRSCIEAWEIDLILDWMVRAGAARRRCGGYMTEEWWWLCMDDGPDPEENEVLADNPEKRAKKNS